MVALVSFTMSIIGLLFSDRIFAAMGAPPHILELISHFMDIWFAGSVFISIPMVGNAAFRAAGDSKTPAVIMVTVAIANAVFAPIFIFGLFGAPRMELQGAALTSVIANAAAMIVGLYFLYKKYRIIDLAHLTQFGHFVDSARRLLYIALPAALTNVLPPLVNAYITKLLATSGAASVAAFGIATRIEALIFIPIMAAAIGMGPIIGQNWGARRMDRVRGVLDEAIWFNIWWSFLTAAVLAVFAKQIAGTFSADPHVIHVAVLFFLCVPISYACGNLLNGWSSAFNAMGLPVYSFAAIVFKMILIMLPAATIGYHVGGVLGLFIAIAVVNIITGLAVHLYGRRMCVQKTLQLDVSDTSGHTRNLAGNL
jgi:putative MATE family efflux protein